MATVTIGLDKTSSKNRIRFETVAQRLQAINIDIVHKIRNNSQFRTTKEVTDIHGILPCYFQEELEELRKLDTTRHFKKFYWSIVDYVQSLPELLLHKEKIVELIIAQIKIIPKCETQSYFILLSVLARDIKEQLYPCFNVIMKGLSSIVNEVVMSGINAKVSNGPNPEMAGKLFECLSHILKSQLSILCKEPDCLRAFYGNLLGNHSYIIREFSSKSFVIVIRKLNSNVHKIHLKKIIVALGANSKSIYLGNDYVFDGIESEIYPIGYNKIESASINSIRRLNNLYEGVALMIYQTGKGVKGCMHSKCIEKLNDVIGNLLPFSQTSWDQFIKNIENIHQQKLEVQKKTIETKNKKTTRNFIKVNKQDGKDSEYEGVQLNDLNADSLKLINAQKSSEALFKYFSAGQVVCLSFEKLLKFVQPSNLTELWRLLLKTIKFLVTIYQELMKIHDIPAELYRNMNISLLFLVEVMIHFISANNGRALCWDTVNAAVSDDIINVSIDTIRLVTTSQNIFKCPKVDKLINRSLVLFCHVWIKYNNQELFVSLIDSLLNDLTTCESISLTSSPYIIIIAREIIPVLEDQGIQRIIKPVIQSISMMIDSSSMNRNNDNNKNKSNLCEWMVLFYDILIKIADYRQDVNSSPYISVDEHYSESKNITTTNSYKNNFDINDMDVDSWGSLSQDDVIDSDYEDDNHASDEIKTKTVVKKKSQRNSTLFSHDVNQLFIDFESHIELILEKCFKTVLSIKDINVMCTINEYINNNELILASKLILWFSKEMPSFITAKASHSASIISLIKFTFELIQSQITKKISEFNLVLLSHLIVVSSRGISLMNESSNGSISLFLPNNLIAVLNDMISIFIMHPLSLSLSWALAEYLLVIAPHNKISDFLNITCENSLVDCIAFALMTPSYWLRYNLLTILTFTTNPTAPSSSSTIKQNNKSNEDQNKEKNQVETCDIARIMLQASLVIANVSSQREFARLLSKLEVLVRQDKLEKRFIQLICGFCIGILHLKFEPFWEAAMLVLVSSAGHVEGEEALWPMLLAEIHKLTIISCTDIQEVTLDHNFRNSNNNNLNTESTKVSTDVLLSYLQLLSDCDNGERRVPLIVSKSSMFIFQPPLNLGSGSGQNQVLVEADARTDAETGYMMIWKVLKKCPNITLKRSKIIVPMFIRFLTDHYYKVFEDDPEVPFLKRIGLFDTSAVELQAQDEIHNAASYSSSAISIKMLKKRLELFLSIFSVVTSPKQLYLHSLLFNYYIEILCKPDTSLVKLALDCLLTYKPTYMVPYKENLKHLLDDKLIRDELVNFDLSNGSDVIKSEHREELVPIITRIVYGRFVSKARGSKAAREQNLARRTAVLSFLSNLTGEELKHLIFLMIRGIIPNKRYIEISTSTDKRVIDKATCMTYSEHLTVWYQDVETLTHSLTTSDVKLLSWERQVGFLFLCEQVIKLLGHSVKKYMPIITKLILLMLEHSHETRVSSIEYFKHSNTEIVKNEPIDHDTDSEEDEDQVEKDESKTTFKAASQSTRVRSLCLLRIGELISQFHGVYSFKQETSQLFKIIQPLLNSLPSSIVGSSHAPALLKIFHAYICNDDTIPLLVENSEIIRVVILCVASRGEMDVVKHLLEIMSRLLEHQNGEYMVPHAQLIIQSFSKRFIGIEEDFSTFHEIKLSELRINTTGSIKRELQLLCQISETLFNRENVIIDSLSVLNLATLLLGMLRTYTTSKKIRVEEEWVGNILRVYKTLLWRIDDINSHVAFISRLFGPAGHTQSLFNLSSVRLELLEVYRHLSIHPSTNNQFDISYKVMVELLSEDDSLIESRDFNRCIPIFQSLSGEAYNYHLSRSDGTEVTLNWSLLIGPDSMDKDNQSIGNKSIAVFEVIRCLYDKELVIRTAGFASMKCLIRECFLWSFVKEAGDELINYEVQQNSEWIQLLKSIILPAIRSGIKQSTDVIKKNFILLLAFVIQTFYPTTVDNATSLVIDDCFHVDLACLLHDDPEQNFFENITHIQLHRRIRAMNRLKTMLIKLSPNMSNESELANININNNDENMMDIVDNKSSNSNIIKTSSFVHVLLPLAYHPIFSNEFTKKDHLALLQESAAFIGAIALYLPWNHYYSTLKTLLKQLSKYKDEKEKILLTCVCNLLDSFHFDITNSGIMNEDELIVMNNTRFEDETNENLKNDSVVINSNVNNNIPENENDEEEDNEAEDDNLDEQSVDSDNKPDRASNKKLKFENINLKSAMKRLPSDGATTSIAKTVINNIFPWVKVFLLKEQKDHKGNKTFVVQPHVALALTKLIHRFRPPFITPKYKLSLFNNLIISVINTLKSRDTTIRDIARDCLSKMILSIGLDYLKPVLYELQHILKEGYQKHVCNYTVRSILTAVLANYKTPVNAPILTLEMMEKLIEQDQLSNKNDEDGENIERKLTFTPLIPSFDSCIELLMNNVLDDILGDSFEDRNADTTSRAVIREAKGSKANDILEIVGKYLLFRPTYALLNQTNMDYINYNSDIINTFNIISNNSISQISSIHALSTPLLDYLSNCDNSSLIGRISEGLQRIAYGLSKNPTINAKELLLYLHATLQPFVSNLIRDYNNHQKAIGKITHLYNKTQTNNKKSNQNNNNNNNVLDTIEDEKEIESLLDYIPSYLNDSSDDEEDNKNLRFITSLNSNNHNNGNNNNSNNTSHNPRKDNVTGYKASTWLPKSLSAIESQREAVFERKRQQEELTRVQDGASAPKLSGYNRTQKGISGTKSGLILSQQSGGQSDPAALQAVKYCLTLFHACLKQSINKNINSNNNNNNNNIKGSVTLDIMNEEIIQMSIPFLPLLSKCLLLPGTSSIVTITIRCLINLLNWGIPIESSYIKIISCRLLKLLYQNSRGMISTDNELAQACLKGLTCMFKMYNTKMNDYRNYKQQKKNQSKNIFNNYNNNLSNNNNLKNNNNNNDYDSNDGKNKKRKQSSSHNIIIHDVNNNANDDSIINDNNNANANDNNNDVWYDEKMIDERT
eukprot:gene8131-11009_t